MATASGWHPLPAVGNPRLYQVNTRILLTELGAELGRPATLHDLPDTLIDEIARRGFDWVWLLGVWQTGDAGRQAALDLAGSSGELRAVLADFTEADVCSSPFAVVAYDTHRDFGGDEALEAVRGRLRERGLRLMLDFVPNHTARDHPWLVDAPQRYVHGHPRDLESQPQNYFAVRDAGPVIAHGRDPYFDGWQDTAQLNYRHPDLRAAMCDELRSIARRCDGVRCDMAMLAEPDVFWRTWGARAAPADGAAPVDEPFWPEALATVRAEHPGFVLMAEVYWDLEWQLQQRGFDFTYDKRLYDRLRDGDPRAIREHLSADPTFQRRSARFLENHDEPRAAAAFAPGVHEAAAVVTYFAPGLRFFHEGQLTGRRVKAPLQLRRRPAEPVDARLAAFYERLLGALGAPAVRTGRWALLSCQPAWDGNPTADRFVAYWWAGQPPCLVVVNLGDTPGQCVVALGGVTLAGGELDLVDRMHDDVVHRRDTATLVDAGLYVDLPARGYHVFEVRSTAVAP